MFNSTASGTMIAEIFKDWVVYAEKAFQQACVHISSYYLFILICTKLSHVFGVLLFLCAVSLSALKGTFK